MKVDFDFIIYASATFLTEHLPVEDEDWDKDKLNKFLSSATKSDISRENADS